MKKLKKVVSPYGKKGASKKIYNILKKMELKKLMQKKFFDLDFKL